jgi:hypothetical protein
MDRTPTPLPAGQSASLRWKQLIPDDEGKLVCKLVRLQQLEKRLQLLAILPKAEGETKEEREAKRQEQRKKTKKERFELNRQIAPLHHEFMAAMAWRLKNG